MNCSLALTTCNLVMLPSIFPVIQLSIQQDNTNVTNVLWRLPWEIHLVMLISTYCTLCNYKMFSFPVSKHINMIGGGWEALCNPPPPLVHATDHYSLKLFRTVVQGCTCKNTLVGVSDFRTDFECPLHWSYFYFCNCKNVFSNDVCAIIKILPTHCTHRLTWHKGD